MGAADNVLRFMEREKVGASRQRGALLSSVEVPLRWC